MAPRKFQNPATAILKFQNFAAQIWLSSNSQIERSLAQSNKISPTGANFTSRIGSGAYEIYFKIYLWSLPADFGRTQIRVLISNGSKPVQLNLQTPRILINTICLGRKIIAI